MGAGRKLGMGIMVFRVFASLLLLVVALGAPSAFAPPSAFAQIAAPVATASKPETSIVTRAVPIGGGQRVDIHAPLSIKSQGIFKPGRKAPVVIYVHGGGWVKGEREKIYNLDSFTNSRNWMLVTTDYRPVPATNIDGQVRDVVRAINWVRANISRYGGNKNKIVLMGHSAGSHLVSMVAAKKLGGKLRGIVANDVQAYDMVAYGGMRGSLPRVYKAAFTTHPENWIKWSPITYVRNSSGGLPPFLIMYSGSDYARRKTLASGFAGALKAKGTRVTLFDGQRYRHGSIASGIGTSPQVTRAVERFLKTAFR